MKYELAIVDAFTKVPFKGNPAAVCLVEQFPSGIVMQSIALEMNQSETAFAVPRDDGDYDLRWFTPAREVDLCGHATLACAHTLGGAARFHTRSGLLTCSKVDDEIQLDFPIDIPVEVAMPDLIEDKLGLSVRWYGESKFTTLAIVDSAAALRKLDIDLSFIRKLNKQGFIVSASGDEPGLDMVSRCFYPELNIDEDPVTGSAHCVFAAYWGKKLGKTELRGYQASARGGYVGMSVDGERVFLTGSAVAVGSVTLSL